jgi:hypothetical protein
MFPLIAIVQMRIALKHLSFSGWKKGGAEEV